MTTPSAAELGERRATFRALHQSGCFVMPNPWDVGSAQVLASLGFPALASTSAGFGFTRGLPDTPTALSVDDVLDHLADLVEATELPINADFQAGYAPDADGVAANVTRCIGVGVAGLSIEDATGRPDAPLFELGQAVERIQAARAAIDASGADVVLTARAESFLVGLDEPLSDALERLAAYARAGADVLFAPGLRTLEDIRVVVDAAGPTTVNVLIGWAGGPDVSDLAAAGVRRISVGSALARVAWGAVFRAAETLLGPGTFDDFAIAAPFARLNQLFG
jgi:2-methylisocitrate lyase-like PEP mutase family enzyme